MSDQHSELVATFRAAYAAANGKTFDDYLGYENGWYVFRSPISNFITGRLRKSELERRVANLWWRANITRTIAQDPRDPDPTKEGVFRDHNCWKCKDGALPCAKGNPRNCENLHARND